MSGISELLGSSSAPNPESLITATSRVDFGNSTDAEEDDESEQSGTESSSDPEEEEEPQTKKKKQKEVILTVEEEYDEEDDELEGVEEEEDDDDDEEEEEDKEEENLNRKAQAMAGADIVPFGAMAEEEDEMNEEQERVYEMVMETMAKGNGEALPKTAKKPKAAKAPKKPKSSRKMPAAVLSLFKAEDKMRSMGKAEESAPSPVETIQTLADNVVQLQAITEAQNEDLLEVSVFPADTEIKSLPSLSDAENQLYRWILTAKGVFPFDSTVDGFMPPDVYMFTVQNLSKDNERIILTVYSGSESKDWTSKVKKVVTEALSNGMLKGKVKDITLTTFGDASSFYNKLLYFVRRANETVIALRDVPTEDPSYAAKQMAVDQSERALFNLIVELAHMLSPSDPHVCDIHLPSLDEKTKFRSEVAREFADPAKELVAWQESYSDNVTLFELRVQKLLPWYKKYSMDRAGMSEEDKKVANNFMFQMNAIEYPLFKAIDAEKNQMDSKTAANAEPTFMEVYGKLAEDTTTDSFEYKELVMKSMYFYYMALKAIWRFREIGTPVKSSATPHTDQTRQFISLYERIKEIFDSYDKGVEENKYVEYTNLLLSWFDTSVKGESRYIDSNARMFNANLKRYLNFDKLVDQKLKDIQARFVKEKEALLAQPIVATDEDMKAEVDIIAHMDEGVARSRAAVEKLKTELEEDRVSKMDEEKLKYDQAMAELEIEFDKRKTALNMDYNNNKNKVEDKLRPDAEKIAEMEIKIQLDKSIADTRRQSIDIFRKEKVNKKKAALNQNLRDLDQQSEDSTSLTKTMLEKDRKAIYLATQTEFDQMEPNARKLLQKMLSHLRNVAPLFFQNPEAQRIMVDNISDKIQAMMEKELKTLQSSSLYDLKQSLQTISAEIAESE